jgi:dephospho-CoA kinase
MIVLGLTGSIGIGKTAVARMFEGLGVPVFYADAAAHEALAKSRLIQRVLKRQFPKAFRKGALDRKKLGDIVFADPKRLRRLEALVHPRVMAMLRRFLEAQRRRNTPLVVLEIPLLFEAGLESVCDWVAVVFATLAVQRRRVLARPGMSARKLERVRARQWPEEAKLARADFVISTAGSKAATAKEVATIVAKLRKS